MTGIMGMESMAILSLGTFLSISLRLVIPENGDGDVNQLDTGQVSIPSAAEKAKPMVISKATMIGMSGCLTTFQSIL